MSNNNKSSTIVYLLTYFMNTVLNKNLKFIDNFELVTRITSNYSYTLFLC